MKRLSFLGWGILGLWLIFMAAAACRPNLQPQVDKLQADKADLEKKVQAIEAEKASLTRDKQSLETARTTLQRQVQTVEGEKATLQRDKQSLESERASLTRDKQSLETARTNLQRQNQQLKEIAGPLPVSLDNFFPPKAPAPVYFLEMLALSGRFEGIITDLQQGDIPGVQANYQAFKAQYEKMAGMVPEWKGLFPTAPVDALGQALASGDPARVGPALGQIGGVCGSCHLLYQTKAHQKYHWPDFSKIQLTDPVAKDKVSWVEYMMRMSGAFDGITNDLQQGQLDNARKNHQAFSARLKGLPVEGCVKCHDTPRTYFVDKGVQDMVDKLGQALATARPDPQAVGQLFMGIGMESCMKCHLVHFPAANTKNRWEKMADLFK